MQRANHSAALLYANVVNTLLTLVELTAALISGSVALKADSFQNLTDTLVLTIAFIAEKVANRSHEPKRKARQVYGIARMTNGFILITLSIFVGSSAIYRIIYPRTVNGALIIAIGLLSLVVNLLAASFLYKHREDAITEAPFIGLLFSSVSGLAVCLAGLGTLYHIERIDGIIGALLSCLLFVRSIRLITFKPAKRYQR